MHRDKHYHKEMAVIGGLSLLWLLIRSGGKPERLRYPCQRMAVANLMMAMAGLGISNWIIWNNIKHKKAVAGIVTVVVIMGIGMGVIQTKGVEMVKHNPICPGGNCSSYQSPRVVVVKDSAVTGNTIQKQYYSSSAINQNVVDGMMERGIKMLSRDNNINGAVQKLFSSKTGTSYSAGKKIGIKVNWNSSQFDWGNRDYLNAVPQTTVALIKQLVAGGVREEDIYVYDCTQGREFYSYFTDYIWENNFKKITYVGDRVSSTYPVVKEQIILGSVVSWDNDTNWCGQVQNKFSYLINMPLLKSHGNEFGITLGFKNHFGSLVNPGNLNHYAPTESLLVPLNNDPIIKNKTILVVGDGLYGAKSSNISPPEVILNTLFFGQDVVATDSVMLDYLLAIMDRNVAESKQTYLHKAAEIGLGVHEHWNNVNEKKYSKIEVANCNGNCSGIVEQPTQIPTATLEVCREGCRDGDANCDGEVGLMDFGIWKRDYQAYGVNGKGREGDMDCQNGVTMMDFGIWKRAYSGK